MFTEPELAQPWELWVRATELHQFIAQNGSWLWPIFQTLHYFGLSLLLGTVGLFDLRVLGVGKAVPPATLHKLIPFGIAGFVLNLLTGIWFFFGFPEQYFYNPSFQLLLTFVAVAGVNVAVFYLTDAFREVQLMPGGANAPARVANCVPLGTGGQYWLVGVALEQPGNIWCIQPAPTDWGSESKPVAAAVPPPKKENEWPYSVFSSKGEAHPGRK